MCMCLHVLPHAAARPLRVRAQDGGLDDLLEVERRLVEQNSLVICRCRSPHLQLVPT